MAVSHNVSSFSLLSAALKQDHVSQIQPGNDPIPKGWVVQKFGGTSLGKFSLEIVDDIIRPSSLNHNVAVVCSAASRSSKSEGTTSRLLRACAESASGDLQYISTIEAIETEHIAAAYREIQTASLRNNLVLRIQAECSAILQELDSSYILKNVDIYSGGRVVSTGEKLICRHMVALLQDRGHQATYVDVSEASNVPADPAEGLNQELLSMLVEDIADKISQADGTPVITGYFGLIQGGLLQKVGRGYTDLCAALVATGLQAKELQIWKEVDGIFTADPRIVPDARLVPSITPIEARELTYYGSEVIHTSTMEQVASEGIPVRIKNVLKPYSSGTIIPPLQLEAHQSETPSALAGPVTAITTKNRIAILTAHCTSSKSSITFYQDLFLALYRWKVSVDLIATSDNNVSLAICVDTLGIDTEHQHSSSPLHDRLENLIQDIRHHGPVTIIPDMAILCIIGKDLKKNSIPSCVFNGLADENIPIEMASYGANQINVSCVIPAQYSVHALKTTHERLFPHRASKELGSV